MLIKPNLCGYLGQHQNYSINNDTIQKKIPARESSRTFVARVICQVNETDQIGREPEYTNKSIYYN